MQDGVGVRAQNVRCVGFNEASMVLLVAAVNAWLATSSERRLLSIVYEPAGATFTAFLTFTD